MKRSHLRLCIAVTVLLGLLASLVNAAVVKASGDLSGQAVKAGDTLDLDGKTWKLTRPILNRGEVTNGKLVGDLAKDTGCIHVPADAVNARIVKVKFSGGNHNGAIRDWGRGTLIQGCTAADLGWGIIAIDVVDQTLDGWRSDRMERGGYYAGSNPDGTGCVNVTIRRSFFGPSKWESPFRVNTQASGLLSDTLIVNAESVDYDNPSDKEAAKFHGWKGRIERCAIIGSAVFGQTPNGQKQTATFEVVDSFVYGYCRGMAGSTTRFINTNVTNTETLRFGGKDYRLALRGGGFAFSLESAVRGLSGAVMDVTDANVEAPTLATDRKPSLTQVLFNGVVINPRPAPATAPTATQPTPTPTLTELHRLLMDLQRRIERLESGR